MVLGNQQLVSIFVIIVVLLSVSFSMGYIIGRNSGPVVSAENRGSAASKPLVVENPAGTPPPSGASPSPAESAAPVDEPKPSPAAPKGTHPVETQAPGPAGKAGPGAGEKPAPPSRAREEKPPEPVVPSVPGEPSPGEYWQVVATSRPDAEIISEALAKKGFKSMLAPAPREGLFRVLVGPFKDSAAMAQTRTELEAAGFKNPLVRKY